MTVPDPEKPKYEMNDAAVGRLLAAIDAISDREHHPKCMTHDPSKLFDDGEHMGCDCKILRMIEDHSSFKGWPQ